MSGDFPQHTCTLGSGAAGSVCPVCVPPTDAVIASYGGPPLDSWDPPVRAAFTPCSVCKRLVRDLEECCITGQGTVCPFCHADKVAKSPARKDLERVVNHAAAIRGALARVREDLDRIEAEVAAIEDAAQAALK